MAGPLMRVHMDVNGRDITMSSAHRNDCACELAIVGEGHSDTAEVIAVVFFPCTDDCANYTSMRDHVAADGIKVVTADDDTSLAEVLGL